MYKHNLLYPESIFSSTISQGSTFVGALDNYLDDLVLAASLRRLSSQYAGPVLQLKKADDPTPQDFGFTSSNYLDVAACIAWLDGSIGRVAKFYDQSGNGNDLVETVEADMPKLFESGAILQDPQSKDGLLFEASQILQTTATDINQASWLISTYLSDLISMSTNADIVIGGSSFNAAIALGDISSGLTNEILAASLSNGFRYGWTDLVATLGPDGHILANHLSATPGIYSDNSANLVNDTDGPFSAISESISIGARGDKARGFNGYINEVLVYSSDQTSNHAALRDLMNNYWGRY